MESNWDEHNVLTLIKFYEVRPYLWNVTLKDYRNKDMERAMEKEIAENLNRTDMWENIFYHLGLH